MLGPSDFLARHPHPHPPTPNQYSLAGLGIAIVNDFKSIEGDRAMGLQSLPVAFGIETAKWICVSTIDVTQVSVCASNLYIIAVLAGRWAISGRAPNADVRAG